MSGPPICKAVDPVSGLKCGLYYCHMEEEIPHRILRLDYPFRRAFERIEWDRTHRWIKGRYRTDVTALQ